MIESLYDDLKNYFSKYGKLNVKKFETLNNKSCYVYFDDNIFTVDDLYKNLTRISREFSVNITPINIRFIFMDYVLVELD